MRNTMILTEYLSFTKPRFTTNKKPRIYLLNSYTRGFFIMLTQKYLNVYGQITARRSDQGYR